MKWPIELTPHVRQDLSEARLWYELQRFGLEGEFAASFYATLEKIAEAPSAQGRFGTRYRKRKLSGFPFTVYFRVGTDRLTMLALIHHRRSPEFIQDQLRRS